MDLFILYIFNMLKIFHVHKYSILLLLYCDLHV